MRVKIKGEVTLEQLARALHEATKVCEPVRPGFKFYGADLYIRPFDADGVAFDVAVPDLNQIVITIPAPPDGLSKPALTANGQARIDSAKAEAKRLIAAQDEADRKRDEEAAASWRARTEEINRKRRIFERVVGLTSLLMDAMPERFVAEINTAIKTVWDDSMPVETLGKNKGKPKAMPFFGIQDHALFLFCETMKNPRRVRNPIYLNDRHSLLWNNDSWNKATQLIAKAMIDLEKEVPISGREKEKPD